MKYFAYGSNMSLSRLRARVPSAKRIGIYSLQEHDLRYHKISNDGSGKCDAFYTGSVNDCVIGVLFEINNGEKDTLDRVEGLGYGYNQKIVTIVSETDVTIEATTYYAIKTDSTLKPYSWYVNHVITGATESNIPKRYIDKFLRIDSVIDLDNERDAGERSIHR